MSTTEPRLKIDHDLPRDEALEKLKAIPGVETTLQDDGTYRFSVTSFHPPVEGTVEIDSAAVSFWFDKHDLSSKIVDQIGFGVTGALGSFFG